LWNTANINVPKLDWNLSSHIDTLIKLPDFEKALKLTKSGKSPGEDNINSELEFRLRLLQFLNNICTKNCIPNEWRNAIVIAVLKKGDTRDPKNYIVISICNMCCKIYSKIFNMKLQSYSEQFTAETQNGFRTGRSCTDRIFCLKLLIEK